MKGMLEYISGDSLFHKLNPLTKLAWAILTCAACFASTHHLFVLGMLILNVAIAAFSGILYKAKGVFKALFFLGLIFMFFQLFFVSSGKVYFYILPGVPITDTGLSYALLLMLKMLAALSPLSMVLMLTPMNELLTAMVDKLKVPYQYAFVVVTALRFIPTFSHEMDQIMQAQMSRGHETDTRNPFKKVRIIIPMCIPLLISSVRRIETMAISIETRGFCTGPRSYRKKLAFTIKDCLIVILFVAILACGILIH